MKGKQKLNTQFKAIIDKKNKLQSDKYKHSNKNQHRDKTKQLE